MPITITMYWSLISHIGVCMNTVQYRFIAIHTWKKRTIQCIFSLLYSVLQILTASDKCGKHLQIIQQYKLQKNKNRRNERKKEEKKCLHHQSWFFLAEVNAKRNTNATKLCSEDIYFTLILWLCCKLPWRHLKILKPPAQHSSWKSLKCVVF